MAGLLFLGDVYLPQAYRTDCACDDEYVLNLEYAMTSETKGAKGKINLKADSSYLAETFGRKPIAVCLANNHVLDYGVQGFEDTVRHLEEAGVSHFGAGTLRDNGNNPLVLEVGDEKVAFMGYACVSSSPILAMRDTPGAMPMEAERVRADLATACDMGATRRAVLLHWGAEDVYLPRRESIALARDMVDWGADIVIGAHAHVIQPFEFCKGKAIFYGLGNSIFPDLDVPAWFDESDQSTRRHTQKQMPWNRKSLAVRYFPTEDKIEVLRFRFRNGVLAPLPCDPDKYRLPILSTREYEARFRRSFLFGKVRKRLARFVTQPKIPRIQHMKDILAILRRQYYR